MFSTGWSCRVASAWTGAPAFGVRQLAGAFGRRDGHRRSSAPRRRGRKRRQVAALQTLARDRVSGFGWRSRGQGCPRSFCRRCSIHAVGSGGSRFVGLQRNSPDVRGGRSSLSRHQDHRKATAPRSPKPVASIRKAKSSDRSMFAATQSSGSGATEFGRTSRWATAAAGLRTRSITWGK